ncbi:hypothetical protein [Agrobacterium sp. FDAARGOS_525]|uniref:hypothetical protein n=1 Tax=Agrobacterium sp. FDAARGOS_525 TaxID=2420311 RepID=UPI00256EAB42|nr:hypothetical protein [Agrobacterium sp. FDAARGOS_525]
MSLIHWIVLKPDNWLGSILGRKPRIVAAVALANKMARIIRAMRTRAQNSEWRDPLPFSKGNAAMPRAKALAERSTDGAAVWKGFQCSEWGKPVPALKHKAL